jgi:hypothetical protein
MCNLPVEVLDSEKLARAIIFPSHFDRKKRKVIHRAFRPRTGTDRISVIRLTHMGADFCKSKGRELAGSEGDKTLKGLAVLLVGKIREIGLKVHDVPEDYCGHAEISYGIGVEANEPLDSENSKRLTDLTKKIFAIAAYHEDPDPAADTWTGSAL